MVHESFGPSRVLDTMEKFAEKDTSRSVFNQQRRNDYVRQLRRCKGAHPLMQSIDPNPVQRISITNECRKLSYRVIKHHDAGSDAQ